MLFHVKWQIRSAFLFLHCFGLSWAHGQAVPLQALDRNSALGSSVQFEASGLAIWQEKIRERVAQGRVESFFPIRKSGQTEWALQMRGQGLTLGRDHLQEQNFHTIPQVMGQFSLGLFARQKRDNDEVWAADFALGRSGTQLLSEESSTSASANLYWSLAPSPQNKKWIFLVSYSNSRSTLNNIPLPGAIYVQEWKEESNQSILALGVPVIFGFFRGAVWSGNLLLTPFASSAELARSIIGPYSLFGRFAWQPQAFLVTEGPKSRVIFDEFKSSLGLRGPVAQSTFLSLQMTFADGRRVFWGDSSMDSSGPGERLPDEFSLGAQVSARF